MEHIYYDAKEEQALAKIVATNAKDTIFLPNVFKGEQDYENALKNIFEKISIGFLSATELIVINKGNKCYCIIEENLEHFKEDLLLTLLNIQIKNLIYVNQADLETIAKFCSGVSFAQLQRENLSCIASSTSRIIKLKGVQIGRGELPPDVKSFDDWFDKISINDFMNYWYQDRYSLLIKWLRRFPGGNHEWIMCSLTGKAKELNIPANRMNALVTPTNKCVFKYGNSTYHHGQEGSTRIHNLLSQTLSQAKTDMDFYTKLHIFIQEHQEGGNKDTLLNEIKSWMDAPYKNDMTLIEVDQAFSIND